MDSAGERVCACKHLLMLVSQRGDGKLLRARHSYRGNIQTNNVCIGRRGTVYVYQGERMIFIELTYYSILYCTVKVFQRSFRYLRIQRGHTFPHFTSTWGLSEWQQLIRMQWIWGYCF